MYQETWIRNGYKKGQKISLKDSEITAAFWTDDQNQSVGIEIDFEEGARVHYEMLIEDWNAFLSRVMRNGQEMCNLTIPSFFQNISCMEFENLFRVNGIGYQRSYFPGKRSR